MDKKEIMDRAIDAAKHADVASVVGRRVRLTRSGQNLLGLCPFHADEHQGSFVVTPAKGIWWCFTENIGGNAWRFVKMYEEQVLGNPTSWKRAAAVLAYEMGAITPEEFAIITGDAAAPAPPKKHVARAPKPAARPRPTAPAGTAEYVYDLLPAVCGLSDAHRRHLVAERGVPEPELRDYFTWPADTSMIAEKVLEAAEADLRTSLGHMAGPALKALKKALPLVPGFYTGRDGNARAARGRPGIGFLVRDEDGKPRGAQIRADKTEPGRPRYVWLSSEADGSRAGCADGASPGSPYGVIRAAREDAPVLVTEGRFKAEQAAAHGTTAVYLAGVGLWRSNGAIDAVKALAGKSGKAYIAFDADSCGKKEVHDQLMCLARALQAVGVEPVILTWRICHGKGLDDLMLGAGAGYRTMMRSRTMRDVDAAYEAGLKKALAEAGVSSPSELEADAVKAFKERLQDAVEQELWPKPIHAAAS